MEVCKKIGSKIEEAKLLKWSEIDVGKESLISLLPE